jgi:hypothetical protein
MTLRVMIAATLIVAEAAMRTPRGMMIHEAFYELPAVPPLPLRRHERVRAAVVALFRERATGCPAFLGALTAHEWKALLHWLDTSGLALYLLDRLRERDHLEVLPEPIRQRLEQNLRDNTERTNVLIEECCAIQREFVRAGISYAVLKGFSLWPHSVSGLELRSQLDLDFLVAAFDESRAQGVLNSRGYRLHAISGRSREFKTPFAGTLKLADLYRPSPQRTVEIHLEEHASGLLKRCEHHTLREGSMPVLPAADLFLGQGLHLYKHLSRDQMRCSHLVELYRHLRARNEDQAFWAQVESMCAQQPRMAASLGLALEFVSHQMEASCVPVAVRGWTIEHAPISARLWVRRYGARMTTASFPGNKLHLLLQEEMAHAGLPSGRSIGRSLVPRRLPPRIAIPPAGETFNQALRRELQQGRFILFRLCFHLREGLRYLRERRNWRRLLAHASSGTPEQGIMGPLHAGSARGATKP